jgi:hypothetical protein
MYLLQFSTYEKWELWKLLHNLHWFWGSRKRSGRGTVLQARKVVGSSPDGVDDFLNSHPSGLLGPGVYSACNSN